MTILPRFYRCFLTCLSAITLLLFLQISPGEAGQWQGLTGKIYSLLQTGNLPAGRVISQQQSTVVLNLTNPSCQPGMELVVKRYLLPGVPMALQNPVATIRLEQCLGSQARGQMVHLPAPLNPGDQVFFRGFDGVNLYTNLAQPDSCPAYRDLLQALQRGNIYCAQLIPGQPANGHNPLIIRFETNKSLLSVTLVDKQQIIHFKQNYNLAYVPVVREPANRNLNLNTAGAYAADERGFDHNGQKASIFQRIPLAKKYNRLVFADLDGDRQPELVAVNSQWIEVFRLQDKELKPIHSLHLPKADFLLSLYSGDFNHNGREELYITAGLKILAMEKPDTKLSSSVIELRNGKLKILDKELPYYLRTVQVRDGNKVLLTQEMGEFEQYTPPIKWAVLRNDKLLIKKNFQSAKGIYSLYNFTLNPFNQKQVLVLDFAGSLGGYDAPTEELLALANDNFGVYDEVAYPQKLEEEIYEGSFNIKRSHVDRFSAGRFLLNYNLNRQSFLIKKRRKINPGVVEQGLNLISKGDIENDQIVGLRWEKGAVLEKTWQSPAIPRDIIDFAFVRLQQQDCLVIMTRNDEGKLYLEFLH